MSTADAITTESGGTPENSPADSFVVFEQPLNERMRSFMRVEFLFDKLAHFIEGESDWDSRISLDTLLEILNLSSRGDIKSELIKELERQINTLERIPDNPSVNGSLCARLLRQLRDSLERLRGVNGMTGNELKRNELLKNISQRASMPGGAGPIDLPHLHYWLQQDAPTRVAMLKQLYETVAPVKTALDMVLNLIRESSPATREIAVNGTFSRTLDADAANQLVRILLSPEERCLAEISTGKYRTSIRFLEPSMDERPKAVNRDVSFHLICCCL